MYLITTFSNQFFFQQKQGEIIKYFGESLLEKHKTTILWTFWFKKKPKGASFSAYSSSTICNRLLL